MRTILAIAFAGALALTTGTGVALAGTSDDHSSHSTDDRHDRRSDSSSHDRHNDNGCAGPDSSNVISCIKLIPINIG